MVLDAAPDVHGVRQVAVVAPHPLVYGAVLDPQGVSGVRVVCPEIREISRVALNP